MLNKFYYILALSLVAIILSSSVTFSYAADYDSPRKQLESGVLPEDIQCRDDKVLVIRNNGNPACVNESTAEKKGWQIIKTEFVQISTNQEDQTNNIKEHPDMTDDADITLANSTNDIIPINSIGDNMLDNIPYPMFVYPILDQRLTTSSEDIKNGSSYSVGKNPWPKTILDTPSQVRLGEPFDVTFTWSMVEFDKETGEIDDISSGDDNFEGVLLTIRIMEGVTLVSAPGFELTDQGTGVGSDMILSEYKKHVDYDDTQIHSETLTFKIDELLEYPYNRMQITTDGSSHDRYFTYSGDVVFLSGDELPFIQQQLSEELGTISFPSVTTFEEDEMPNPQFINSLADFLKNNVSTDNMTQYLQQEDISDGIIDAIFQKYPELEN